MCEKTERTPNVIKNFLSRMKINHGRKVDFGISKDAIPSSGNKLPRQWKSLKNEFTKQEFARFIKKYNSFVAQFNNEVMASEDMQIVNVLRFDCLIGRIMKLIKQGKVDIARLYKKIGDFNEQYAGKDLTDAQFNYLTKLEDSLAATKASQSAKISELTKLHAEYRNILKDLKATRDQRLEKIESSSKDFMGLIKAMEEKDFREQEGRQLELVKIATEKESVKLRQEIKYPDGEFDSPILDSETVLMEEEKDE